MNDKKDNMGLSGQSGFAGVVFPTMQGQSDKYVMEVRPMYDECMVSPRGYLGFVVQGFSLKWYVVAVGDRLFMTNHRHTLRGVSGF